MAPDKNSRLRSLPSSRGSHRQRSQTTVPSLALPRSGAAANRLGGSVLVSSCRLCLFFRQGLVSWPWPQPAKLQGQALGATRVFPQGKQPISSQALSVFATQAEIQRSQKRAARRGFECVNTKRRRSQALEAAG